MVYVPSAEKYGFSLRLDEGKMRDVLNSSGVKHVLRGIGDAVHGEVVNHVQATAGGRHAANYVEALFQEDAFSDDYGFNFDGPYELGNRPIVVIGVPAGRGNDPTAKPPLLVESQTHSLTASAGFSVGGIGEDIR